MADEKPIEEGPGKGKPFFTHAKTVADSGNYDYAVELYIQGLVREPANIPEHDALRRVAMERKVKGGKPAGGFLGPKLPMKGKAPKDQLLNAEYLLAKDPSNITHMLTILRAARDAGYADVIRWFAPTVILANKAKPKKEIYLEIAELYRGLRDFEKAADCLQQAAELSPNDLGLQQQIKDVAAEAAMDKGKFGEVDNFKKSLKSEEETKNLLQEDALAKSREYRLREVEKAREDYESSPLDHRMVTKYAKALRDMEEEEFEAEAMRVLQKAFEQTKTYQYKRSIGEIQIRQLRRQISAVREHVRFHAEDEASKEKLKALSAQQLKFELEVYYDWAEHYPTDMTIVFEYGRRLYLSKQYEKAIGAFQQAQINPKYRIEAMYFLAMCFEQQKMLPEAAGTLESAVKEYELAETGGDLSKRLYYALARMYEDTNRAGEAAQIYSKIARWDINYRDVRTRLESARKQAG